MLLEEVQYRNTLNVLLKQKKSQQGQSGSNAIWMRVHIPVGLHGW